MRLYIMRHGETEWNVRRLYQGHSDIPLNENGVALAEITGRGLRDIPFDLAFTSPLRRARQTGGDRPPGPGRPSGRGAQAHRDRLRRLRGLHRPPHRAGPSSGPQSPQLHPGPGALRGPRGRRVHPRSVYADERVPEQPDPPPGFAGQDHPPVHPRRRHLRHAQRHRPARGVLLARRRPL